MSVIVTPPTKALVWLEWHRQWKLWLTVLMLIPIPMELTRFFFSRYLDPFWVGGTIIYILLPLLLATNAFRLLEPADRRQCELPVTPLRLVLSRLGATLGLLLPLHAIVVCLCLVKPELLRSVSMPLPVFAVAGTYVVLLLVTAVLLFTSFDLGAESAILAIFQGAVMTALFLWFLRQMTYQDKGAVWPLLIATAAVLSMLLLGIKAWASRRLAPKLWCVALAVIAFPLILVGIPIAQLAIVYKTQTPEDFFSPSKGWIFLPASSSSNEPVVEVNCIGEPVSNLAQFNVLDGTWKWCYAFRLRDLKLDSKIDQTFGLVRVEPGRSNQYWIGHNLACQFDEQDRLEFINLNDQTSAFISPPSPGAFSSPRYPLIIPDRGLLLPRRELAPTDLGLWWLQPNQPPRRQILSDPAWGRPQLVMLSPDAQWLILRGRPSRNAYDLVNLENGDVHHLPDFPEPDNAYLDIRLFTGGSSPTIVVHGRRGIACWKQEARSWSYMQLSGWAPGRMALSPDGQRVVCTFQHLRVGRRKVISSEPNPGLQVLDLSTQRWQKVQHPASWSILGFCWATNDYLVLLTTDTLVRVDPDGKNPYTLLAKDH